MARHGLTHRHTSRRSVRYSTMSNDTAPWATLTNDQLSTAIRTSGESLADLHHKARELAALRDALITARMARS